MVLWIYGNPQPEELNKVSYCYCCFNQVVARQSWKGWVASIWYVKYAFLSKGLSEDRKDWLQIYFDFHYIQQCMSNISIKMDMLSKHDHFLHGIWFHIKVDKSWNLDKPIVVKGTGFSNVDAIQLRSLVRGKNRIFHLGQKCAIKEIFMPLESTPIRYFYQWIEIQWNIELFWRIPDCLLWKVLP